jgi:hypothetical protein
MTDPGTKKRWLPTDLRLGAVVAVVLGLALLAFVLLSGGDDDDDSAGGAGARVVSVEELQETAGSRDRPIFWAGPRSGATYEFTETSDGSTYVRYLTGGAEVGDPSPNFLTVATYPLDNGYARVVAAGRREGAETTELQNGGIALVNEDRPSSVYLAYPRGKYQVEVYDPSPEEALDLVVSGAVQPVR